ncbi:MULTISPECIES: hypothetical protein [unclassified Curtobacterium]|uniref:hypothetical protein n=1 Tax=unclassified Curtobacterium TaxID=257496 RepID=UPI0015E8CC38|nr:MULTISPECIES: hypothetical protein [unclassified Curtobacterium]WIB11553.1 hypothetical protein DEJ36_11300 [Curtobacterium sp. MCPF17_052]
MVVPAARVPRPQEPPFRIEPDTVGFALADALEACREFEAGELSGRAVVVSTL